MSTAANSPAPECPYLPAGFAQTVRQQSPRWRPADQQCAGAVHHLCHPDSSDLGAAFRSVLHCVVPLLGHALPPP